MWNAFGKNSPLTKQTELRALYVCVVCLCVLCYMLGAVLLGFSVFVCMSFASSAPAPLSLARYLLQACPRSHLDEFLDLAVEGR